MLMNYSVGYLVIISVLYLLMLFSIAWLSENTKISSKLTKHPIIYVLSLGVYNSAWAFYGMIALVKHYGYGYLAIGLGFTGAFLLMPVLMYPILKLTQTYQLSSLADLFSFRFRSRWAGVLTCIFMLIAMLPLIALQIRAVTESITLLTHHTTSHWISLIFCSLLVIFAVLFGSRQVSIREKRTGLVMAIAFESVVKLLVFLIIAGYIVYSVFGGFTELNAWLNDHKEVLVTLKTPLQEGPWRALLLCFFAATVVMPHMFHLTFTENVTPKALMIASWGAPLYLLIIAFCVPIIFLGAVMQGSTINPEFYILAIGVDDNNQWLSLVAYIGGLAAASGLIIVSTIALSGMILNHLVLPFYTPTAKINIYRQLKGLRRTLIVIIILLGYLFYLVVKKNYSNNELGITAFSATLQFFPGVLGVLYWKLANKKGFITGLLIGMSGWLIIMLVPLVSDINKITLPFIGNFPLSGPNDWHLTSIVLLSINALIFIMISCLSKHSKEEKYIANLCAVNTTQHLQLKDVSLTSPQEFIQALEGSFGAKTARKEVKRALDDLGFSMTEHRSYALRQLREQIEVNLSGLMGPHIAQQIVDKFLPYQTEQMIAQNEDIYFMENRLESYESRLTGLAAELDALRRYHRLTLQALPIGVCSVSKNQDILLWNRAMERLTSLPADKIIGANLKYLESSWQEILIGFVESLENHIYKQTIVINGQSRLYNLHKAAIGESVLINSGGVVILVEDITEIYLLEDQLIHSERLASIGRLAAGVAHEIGNPVTGIACLAQILQEEWADHREIKEMSGQIIEQTKRISKIVHSLMSFAHTGEHAQSNAPVGLYEITHETIHLLVLNKEKKPVNFQNLCNPNHKVIGNSQRLTQVLINLLDNARDASPENGAIIVISHDCGNEIELCIEDEGEGINDEIKARIFEPFFTTKEPGVGTGLGLALVYSIIENSHGKITLKSPMNLQTKTGTCFSITLPKYIETNML